MIGFVSAWEQNRSAEIGYVIQPPFQQQGLATEVLFVVAGYAFAEYNFRKLRLLIDADNLASIRVAEKVGFLREGCLRGHVRKASQWIDELHYGLFIDELVDSI